MVIGHDSYYECVSRDIIVKLFIVLIATQARPTGRSVSCDTGTFTEMSFPEHPRASSTPVKRKRFEVSADDSSYHLDGSDITVHRTMYDKNCITQFN